jgi:hypothetical protein
MQLKIEGVKEINPNNYGGMCSREIHFERKELDFEKGIETIATTDAPALVVDWERFQVIREVLPMEYYEKTDKVPLLDSHSRFSIEKIKGSAKNFRTEGSQLICDCFISKAEGDVREKISEGHIDSVSIGYETRKDKTVEVPKDGVVSVNGREYKNDFKDDIPFVVRTWWKTKELSLVPIGADSAAKFKSMEEGKFFDILNKQKSEIEDIRKQLLELKKVSNLSKKQLEKKLFTMKHELKLN